MATTAEHPHRRRRLSWLALALSIGGVAAALVAALGSARGAWDFRVGFTILRYAFFVAIAGGLLAILDWVRAWRAHRDGRANAFALLISAAFVGWLGQQIVTARTVPAIHDISTDLEDVPEFRALEVRADNLDSVPEPPGLAGKGPEDRWQAIHRGYYGDIDTLHVAWSVPETIEKARVLAEKEGWHIAHFDPSRGNLEATDTSLFFGFKDDVVVRARRAERGGTDVDMRSISRVGASDVGVNAARIREFLDDLRRS